MVHIILSEDQVRNLVTLLGAAEGTFTEMAKDEKTPAIFRNLLTNYVETSEGLRDSITSQFNEQVK